MVRGFGGPIGPISTFSTKEIFWSQLDVVLIDVGRVMVAVIMYEMVPRSNYAVRQSMPGVRYSPARVTHINATWKPFPGKFQREMEFIDAGLYASLIAYHLFILEQRGVAVPEVLRLSCIARR